MSVTTSIWDAALTTIDLIKTYLGTDEKADLFPSRSSTYDIIAAEWNKIVSGLAEVALRLRYGNLCQLLFSTPDATASLTNSDLFRASGYDAALTQALAPMAGSIVGLAVHIENARSAGSLVATWTKNGTEQTLAVTIDGTHDQSWYAMQLPGVEEFAAGDLLGVSITTDGSWAAGATPSVSAELLVAYGE